MNEDSGAGTEVSVETPVGKLATKNVKAIEVLSLGGVAAASLMIYMLYQHMSEAKEASAAVAGAISKLADSQVKAVHAQRELTCIISLPQDKREQEFNSPFGFCKRVTQ